MPKTCVLCAYWQPDGKIQGIIRHGGKCKLNDKEARMDDKCILWKICSPNQLEQRKEAGLVQDIEEGDNLNLHKRNYNFVYWLK